MACGIGCGGCVPVAVVARGRGCCRGDHLDCNNGEEIEKEREGGRER